MRLEFVKKNDENIDSVYIVSVRSLKLPHLAKTRVLCNGNGRTLAVIAVNSVERKTNAASTSRTRREIRGTDDQSFRESVGRRSIARLQTDRRQRTFAFQSIRFRLCRHSCSKSITKYDDGCYRFELECFSRDKRDRVRFRLGRKTTRTNQTFPRVGIS